MDPESSAPRDRTPFGFRMWQARKRASLTQMQVRKAIGVSQGTLSEAEHEHHTSGLTPQFAALYGCSAHWLATGEGDPQWTTPGTPDPLLRGVGQSVNLHSLTVVPVIRWEDLMSEEMPQVFKVAIPDEALEPNYRRGVHVELTRGLEARPGDGVLVRDRDGNHFLRVYRQRRAGEWSAHALHPAYESLDAETYGLTVVAVVTATEGRWS